VACYVDRFKESTEKETLLFRKVRANVELVKG
jgi:hypothetical protein